jgi:hypothetical protein
LGAGFRPDLDSSRHVGGAPGEATDFNEGEFAAVIDHVRTLQKQGKLKVRTVGDAVAPQCSD